MRRLGGALIGAGFLVWITGLRGLWPGEIGWLMRYDWRTHFLGWHLFRSEAWHWPPGRLDTFYAPIGTSIGFTDSIPLVALLLKPFTAWLPPTFQYLGLWLLLCFALQGVFAVALMQVWTRKAPLQLLGAAILVLMPTLLVRIGHPALCAHWLLLWALWIACRDQPGAARPLEWGALGLVAGLVHPYLAVMTLALLAGTALAAAPPWQRAGRRAAVAMLSAGFAVLGGWWLSGLFAAGGAESLATEGLGHFSMNLLSPITAVGWSAWLPDLPRATAGQDYEGFQYFGVGVLALVPVGLVLATRHPGQLPWRQLWAVLAVVVLMALFALSPKVTIGSATLVDWSGPWTGHFAVFRASGRFFWPLAYLLVVSLLALVVTRVPARAAMPILAVVVGLQFADFHRAHAERRYTARNPAFHEWSQPMVSPAWASALAHYRRLVLYPPPQCGPAPIGFEAPAWLAGLNGVSINAGDVARPNLAARLSYCHALGDAMKAGRLDDDALYIVTPTEVAAIRAAAPAAVCGVVDGLSVCATAASYQAWRNAASLD